MKPFFTFLLLFILIRVDLPCQVNLPAKLGATNIGNDFWFSLPPSFEDESGGANYIKIFVISEVNTSVTVEVPGRGYKTIKYTIPNDVIEFNVPGSIASVWQKHAADIAPAEKVFSGYGIHVYSEGLISVYALVRYHWTSDGFLCIPTHSLGKEYIVGSTYGDMCALYRGYLNNSPSETEIVAAYPDTKVIFTLGGNDVTKTTGGLKPGQSDTAFLQKGDVWSFASLGEEADLSGSKIVATKPVAVVSGNYCANIPTKNKWCDYIADMERPCYSWGKTYYGGKVLLGKRKYPSVVRIYTKDDNTSIFRNGVSIGKLIKGGGKLNEAYIEARMGPMDSGPVSAVYTGDKPVNVVFYNTGSEEDHDSTLSSDPFVMPFDPTEQFYKEATFCVPGIAGGQTYPDNYINLVYQIDANGKMPDDMEFAYVNGEISDFQKMNKLFPETDDKFIYSSDSRKFALKKISLPNHGVFKIRAQQPFGLYSYGRSDYDSYGYPSAGLYMDYRYNDNLPPVPTFTINSNGYVTDGKATDKPDNPANRSNMSMIALVCSNSNNYHLTFNDFVAGQDSTATWGLNVIDPLSDAKARVIFADRNGNDTTVDIKYTSPYNKVKVYGIYDTMVKINKNVILYAAIKNSGNNSITFSDLKLKNGKQGFEFLDLKPQYVLNPGDSLSIPFKYFKNTTQNYEDTLLYTVTGNSPGEVTLHVRVVAPYIYLYDVYFNNTKINTTDSTKGRIINNGYDTLIIYSYVPVTNSVFTIKGLPSPDELIQKPLVILPLQEYDFMIYFSPTKPGSFNDKIIIRSNSYKVDSTYSISGQAIISDVKDDNEVADIFDVYPNPANNELNIILKTALTEKISFSVCDIFGNTKELAVLENIDKDNSTYKAVISELSDGMYILRANFGGRYYSKKFIILK